MHTPGPIDVQSGPDIGCRIGGCCIQSDVAYILCAEHQQLARAAPKLLEALEALRHEYLRMLVDYGSHVRGEPAVQALADDAIKQAKS